MKRTALRARKIPVARTDSGNVAPWGDLADTFEDRVSESLVDYEDEREVVEVVLQGTTRSVH
jgi:hypothetical protein